MKKRTKENGTIVLSDIFQSIELECSNGNIALGMRDGGIEFGFLDGPPNWYEAKGGRVNKMGDSLSVGYRAPGKAGVYGRIEVCDHGTYIKGECPECKAEMAEVQLDEMARSRTRLEKIQLLILVIAVCVCFQTVWFFGEKVISKVVGTAIAAGIITDVNIVQIDGERMYSASMPVRVIK